MARKMGAGKAVSGRNKRGRAENVYCGDVPVSVGGGATCGACAEFYDC